MGQAWIEDSERPGGVGRAERERVFWERVASGRKSPAREKSRRGARQDAPSSGQDADRAADQVAEPIAEEAPLRSDSPWESAYLAVATILGVVVFGLGWVSIERERATGVENSTGYDWSLRDSGSHSTLLAQIGRAGSD